MLISLVTLISTLVFLKATQLTLVEPENHCVPTSTVRGPCHTCVCSHEGVFHCRPQKCENEKAERSRPKAECVPNFIYREDNTFCRCSNEGLWVSDNCETTFKHIYPRTNVLSENMKTNITCKANNLYLIDCNVCRCSENGFIDVTLCTRRSCRKGHKAESCSFGDILRVENQLCTCSDIDFYVDRLCIKISDEVIQPLETKELLKLENIGSKMKRRATDLVTGVCDTTVIYTIDCNNCICIYEHLHCTKNECVNEIKTSLRQNVNEIESLPELLNGIKCVPGKMYRKKCNICTCSKNGTTSCTTMICLQDQVLDIQALRGVLSSADVTKEKVKLPEIKYGDKCIYGKKYRMDCNTCHCGHQNNLLCTKAACLLPMGSEINENAPKAIKRSKGADEQILKKKKKVRRIVRRENIEPLTTDSSGFPALPAINNTCIPGRIYQEGCQRCLCNSDRKPECSTENVCKQAKMKRDLQPVDVRPQIKDKEFKELPVLPHSASPCKAGKTYKVDCNACVCDEFQNLLCDKLLCISFADMHRAEALKKSGLPCNSENFVENDVMQSKCVQCACNGTTYCQAKAGCVAETEKMLRTRRNGLAFNYTAEKCAPEHIYKDNCNKCYCQEDQTLRCTQKTCLNYNQAVILEKQQKYLQEHGL